MLDPSETPSLTPIAGTAEFKEGLAHSLRGKVAEAKENRLAMNRLVSRDLCQRLLGELWEEVALMWGWLWLWLCSSVLM